MTFFLGNHHTTCVMISSIYTCCVNFTQCVKSYKYCIDVCVIFGIWTHLRSRVRVLTNIMSVSDQYYPRHLASRRVDYERVFTWVNSKADIISGALFKLSGTLFRVPETSKLSGTLFCQLGQIYCMCVYECKYSENSTKIKRKFLAPPKQPHVPCNGQHLIYPAPCHLGGLYP